MAGNLALLPLTSSSPIISALPNRLLLLPGCDAARFLLFLLLDLVLGVRMVDNDGEVGEGKGRGNG